MTGRARHPLAGGRAPAWASAWGEDVHGPWVELHLGARKAAGAGGSAALAAQGGAVQRFRWIPPGVARLGSPKGEWGRWADDWAPTPWRLREGFWLADTPCTCALWAEVMGGEVGDAPARPRVHVSWEDAHAFLAALRARDPGLAFELPSEARWEYACRAATETSTYAGEVRSEKDAERVLDGIAWWAGNADEHAMPVATKSPNVWGLYDMLGNVLEWCEDAWDDGGAPRLDAQGPLPADMGARRVLRGGSWSNDARLVRAAYRSAYHPVARLADVGFRLSRGQ